LEKITQRQFTTLRDSNHGPRTTEEEEEIFDPEGQDEAEVEEGQPIGQSYHRSELVHPTPSSTAHLSILQPFTLLLLA
jgi:hypothetical protein